MRLGIFAKTFAGSDPLTVLTAARVAGFAAVQYNMACSGLPAMPDDIDPVQTAEIAAASTAVGLGGKGLNQSVAILRAKKALSEMLSGQVLKVVATDAGSVRDFEAFAKQTGNELLLQENVGDEYIHTMRRR